MKSWACVQVIHYKDVDSKIEEWERNGWELHTYAYAQIRGSYVNHYLLFERESKKYLSSTYITTASACLSQLLNELDNTASSIPKSKSYLSI